MEAQRTAYRRFRSVFGVASTPNTGFGNTTPIKHNTEKIVFLKHNAENIAELGQYLGLHQNQKYWSAFEILSQPNTDPVDSDSIEIMRADLSWVNRNSDQLFGISNGS